MQWWRGAYKKELYGSNTSSLHTPCLISYHIVCFYSNFLAYRDIDCWMLLNQSKSDCICHSSIVFRQKKFHLVKNESDNGKYNLISIDLTGIRSRLFWDYPLISENNSVLKYTWFNLKRFVLLSQDNQLFTSRNFSFQFFKETQIWFFEHHIYVYREWGMVLFWKERKYNLQIISHL